MLDDITARPYFIRAAYQWCVDRGHTPYLLTRWRAEQYPDIPPKLADKEGIVFNISSPAVRSLVIDADGVFFTGRFWGKIVEVRAPLADVIAIYAREVQKGFSLPPCKEEGEKPEANAAAVTPAAVAKNKKIPNLRVI